MRGAVCEGPTYSRLELFHSQPHPRLSLRLLSCCPGPQHRYLRLSLAVCLSVCTPRERSNEGCLLTRPNTAPYVRDHHEPRIPAHCQRPDNPGKDTTAPHARQLWQRRPMRQPKHQHTHDTHRCTQHTHKMSSAKKTVTRHKDQMYVWRSRVFGSCVRLLLPHAAANILTTESLYRPPAMLNPSNAKTVCLYMYPYMCLPPKS